MSDKFAFLLPVVMSLFGLAFLVVARFGGRASAYWGAGYLSAALAFVLPMFIPLLPVKPTVMATEALFFAAFMLYGHALLVHFARPTLLWARLAIAVPAYLGIGYAVIVAESLDLELMISDATCVSLLLVAIVAVAGRARRPADRLLFWVVAAVCAENLVRFVAFSLLGGPMGLEEFAGSAVSFFIQVTATVGAMAMALTALGVMTVDMIERHRTEAERDLLTGLLNRRGFDRAVSRLLAEKRPDIAVILFDIDHFKKINDDHGHAAGDEVIRAVAEMTAQAMPKDAVLARFGGEEFVALLPDHGLSEASEAAARLQDALKGNNWAALGGERTVTASFGIDALARGDHAVYDAIKRADDAMYEAKRAGRNRIVTTRPTTPVNLRLVTSNK